MKTHTLRTDLAGNVLPLALRKHTRIFQLSEAHFDELIRRRIQRQDAAALRAARHRDRIEQVSEAIREHRGHEWGSVGTAMALEEELDALLNADPEEEEGA